jgi:raffinose/stachyose/melibiose transport system permease protein
MADATAFRQPAGGAIGRTLRSLRSTPPGGKSRRTPSANFWLAVAPAIAIYSVFTIWPIAQVVASSVTNASGFGGTPDLVGLDNFVEIFGGDPELVEAAVHTAIYAFFLVIVQTILAFFIAVLLNKKVRGSSIYRAAFFAPIVISPVAVVFTWSFMFDPTTGTINSALRDLGLGSLAQDWLGNYDLALYSVIIVDLWSGIGFSIVIFLAGLGTIPIEVTEAALVDGAGKWRTVTDITLPLMKPAFGLVAVLAINGALRAFNTVYLMTQGGPGNQTDLIMTRIFSEAFVRSHFGYASAIATLLVVVLVAVAAAQNRLDSKLVSENR